jgi:hypothetical protein
MDTIAKDRALLTALLVLFVGFFAYCVGYRTGFMEGWLGQ